MGINAQASKSMMPAKPKEGESLQDKDYYADFLNQVKREKEKKQMA